MWMNHYNIIENKGEKQGFLVAIAQHKNDLNIQLIKWAANTESLALEQLQHEWNLYHHIKSHSDALLIPHKKIKWGISEALLYPLEHKSIAYLSDYLIQHTLSIAEGLSITLDLVDALILLQKEGLRHRNVHPNAIFYNAVTQHARLSGLQFSSALHIEKTHCYPEHEISLSYMSPEQTRAH